ncbi:MAG: YitT family protein [bacterium]|nr:YitT family protein [bacterium]
MKNNFKDFLYMAIGVILCPVAYSFFLVPAKINTGGLSGISMIIHHLFNTPFGIVLLIANIPLLVIGVKQFGAIFGVRTVIAVILISLISDLFSYIFKFLVFTGNPLLSAVYGGVFLGMGLGFIFKGRGSTGGSDIVGRLMSKYSSFSVGYSIFIIDSIIISLSGLAFRNYELILYSFITLFLSSKVIDIVLEGQDYASGVYIFTNKPDEISGSIMKNLSRGVSAFKGLGMYMKEEKMVLYCVVSKREISILTQLIQNEDREAFVVVTNVHEVLGKGFPRRT